MTKLGAFIRKLLLDKNGKKQNELAREMGYSESLFSNILNGKARVDMEFILKCHSYFKLDKDKTIELFNVALSSTPNKIIIETEYLEEDRKNMLLGILVTLLLYPRPQIYDKKLADITEAAKLITGAITGVNSQIEVPKINTLK